MNLRLFRTSLASSGKLSAVRAALGFCLVIVPASAQTGRSCAEIEAFMHQANLIVLGGVRALMDDGIMQHAVFVHLTDEGYRPDRCRDTWKAAVAGYELAKMLQLNIIPPQVEIKVDGKPASASWGLDDVMMDDAQRSRRNVQPPDLEAFRKQMHIMDVFDELLNGARAATDLLITEDWQLWIVTPSQGFMPNKTLRNPGNLVKCDRKLLAKLRTLDQVTLMNRLGNWLTKDEIDALYSRATQIVDLFDQKIAAEGEAAVLVDLDRSGSDCAL
jgi:hypothetical protein